MEDVTYLSDEKKKELEVELDDLKNVKRREIATKINEAKEQGDLSENAEYHQAREEQGFIEGRILELEDILRRALIVKPTSDHATIRVGSHVKVRVEGRERDVEIVGSQEAEPSQGKISNESPLGQSLIGHHVGDVIEVMAPKGAIRYEVKKID